MNDLPYDPWKPCPQHSCEHFTCILHWTMLPFHNSVREATLRHVNAMVSTAIDAELRRKLPEGMEHCTIVFRECELGHGRLVATNWTDSGCLKCLADDERERCAAICEQYAEDVYLTDSHSSTFAALELARRIRSGVTADAMTRADGTK